MKIYKYDYLEGCGEFVVEMPEGAIVLSTEPDCRNRLCFWALVDSNAPLVKRYFYCVGTGLELNEFNGKFIGTVKKEPYIWHLFEIEKGEN